MTQSGWIGVDLDGTLAEYHGWNNGLIGAPVPAMVKRVKEWLAEGVTVKIFTARVCSGDVDQRIAIKDWCKLHIGQELDVTALKDFAMIELWDDRCVQVIPNTGIPIISTLPDAKIGEALREAAKILWFDDDSDYGNALWKIVEFLGGEDKVNLLTEGNDEAIEKWLFPKE